MAKKLIQENPALFLGELRADLVRIYGIDDLTGKRHKIKVSSDETDCGCREALIPYPNEVIYEVMDEECE